ncbi:MAG TPA: hypothetical protein PLJ35_00280 [Anaerolineae bacterium]|nr:hypothetical protein [Anaerolineae bacterium]HOQ97237.1 hypothetical protein [Anaerolineae bacterium]HPL26462.1 hypothetical protein [Anaerolineae bacterium]
MRVIDLAVAWAWSHDAGFVDRLFTKAASQGLATLAITGANLAPVLRDLAEGRLRIRRLLDRAVDEQPNFAPLAPLAAQGGATILNPIERQDRACDKARNHLLCASQGIPVPLTVIVSPFMHDPSPPQLPAALGRPFVAKPAGGSGGIGVVLNTMGVEDVQQARRTFSSDRYLLQQRVLPRALDGRRAWFRVFYVRGHVIPCWWDDVTHVYAPLLPDEEVRHGLAGLRPIVVRAARLVGLDFFTTEIVLGGDGRLVCVDYANAPCDMRLQSAHRDGVPDAVVDRVAGALIEGLQPRDEPVPICQALAGEARQ